MKLPDSSRTLYLVDVSSFIFRAFFAIRHLTNSKGEPTNAVYGVASMLAKLLQQAKPQYFKIVFDSKEPSFRKTVYTEYKANRSAPPEDLVPQFDRIEELIQSLKMPSIRRSGVEADDLIASLTGAWLKENPDHQVVIVSGDKDLMQLVNDRVVVWDTMKEIVFGPAEVQEKFGIAPYQVRDYLAMVGDSSDNIPGVPSIGPKTAVDLLKAYTDFQGILDAAKAGKISGKKGQVIQDNEKLAHLSYELVGLKHDLPVPSSPDELSFQFQVTDECLALFKELDFHGLIKQWQALYSGGGSGSGASSQSDSGTGVSGSVGMTGPAWRTVDQTEALDDLIAKIHHKGEVSFDLETTSLNPRVAKIVGFSFCCDESESFYIPVGHQEGKQLPMPLVLEKLMPVFSNPKIKKIGQNLKYDLSVLFSQHSIQVDGIGADTMIADYVLESEGRHGLDAMAMKHLGHSMLTYEEVCGKGKDQIGFDQVSIERATHYAAEDAWAAFCIWNKLQPQILKEALLPIFAEIDLPLMPVLMRMELEGVSIDDAYLKNLSLEFERELDTIETQIFKYTKEPINLNSPKQLAQLLFEDLKLPVQSKTKTGYSTDASVLEALSSLHEVPKLLMEYREISKLKGTYVDPLPLLKDPKTGKIHTHYHQTVTATGRLSSSDPNLQNIPIRSERGKRIRRAFIPSPGRVLLSADYSQIELRILAHMSEDPILTDAFVTGADIHRRTAAEIYSVPESEVDDSMRSVAKAINFGLIYGKTAFGLSQELKIPRKQAQEFIDRYFAKYPKIQSFLNGLIEQARESGMTYTLSGRKRYLKDITSKNGMIRANAERMAMNTPIQGTAADLMKIAMIQLDEKLQENRFQSKLIMQVHDEVVLDVVPSELERVSLVVRETLENAMSLKVPLTVNLATGSNWQDL